MNAPATPASAPEIESVGLRQRLEQGGIGLAMALVLSVGFYWIDFRNLAADQAGSASPWITEIALDASIPFSPIWVWPYLSYFPLCFVPLFFCGHLQRFRRIAAAYMLTYGPSLLMFALVPSRMIRPEFEVVDWTTSALAFLYKIDPGYNIFPSLHVANAILVALIVQRHAPKWGPLLWAIAAAICASTVLVKQHYVVDIPAGIALGFVAFLIPFKRIKRREGDPDVPAGVVLDSAAPP